MNRPICDPPAVILTGGEHLSVLAAVRALRAAGYAPWVAVHEQGTYAARSRDTAGIIDVPIPWVDGGGWVREIAAAAERIPARVVLPGTEYAMDTLARHAGDFPPGVALGTGSRAAIANATDKGRLVEFARAAGLSVPPTVDMGLSALPVRLPYPYPVVVKPHRSELRGRDGVVRHFGAHYARSTEELRAALAALPGERGLVQPFMRGPMWSFAGVFWEGRMVCAVQSRGDRLWPVPCGSISHAETVPLDPRLCDALSELLRAVGWSGLFQVDLFMRAGEFVVTDLNPRFFTSLGHATRAGVNLPGIWVDLLLGREPRVAGPYRVGVHYRHDEGDLRALAHMLTHGQRAAAFRGVVPRPDTAMAVFSARDPWPVMTSFSRLLQRYRPARVREAKRAVSRALVEPTLRPAPQTAVPSQDGVLSGSASPTRTTVSRRPVRTPAARRREPAVPVP